MRVSEGILQLAVCCEDLCSGVQGSNGGLGPFGHLDWIADILSE